MRRTIPSLMLLTATSFAAVPVSFSSGTPAKADDVNKNFAALDSAIQKKGDAAAVTVLQSAVAGMASQASLGKLSDTVKGKADTGWVKTKISAAQSSNGALLASQNLSDLSDKSAARTNLGLKTLATSDTIAWSKVSKIGAKAADLEAFDSATAKNRFLPAKSGATLGGDLNLGGFPIRDLATNWLLGIDKGNLNIGSQQYSRPIVFWTGGNPNPDSAVVIDANHVTIGRNSLIRGVASINGDAGYAAINLLGSGSGTFDRSVVYSYPPPGVPGMPNSWLLKGLYIEIPRLSAEDRSSSPSNFEINVRGGNKPIMRYDGTANLITLHQPTKINDLTIGGSLKTASGLYKASDVADYVFEPDYKLASLSEVEAYTKEHKHLPEVPSATEIEQGGMDLAKMNLLLLKKVEELTLHTIELEKRMKAFESTQKH